MAKRPLMLILFGCLMGVSAWAQDTAARPDPEAGFHLNGVLISQSGRSALVNGQYSQEGDRVAGAKILAIEEGAVRILVGMDELIVPVGSTVDPREAARLATRQTREPARRESVAQSKRPAVAEPSRTVAAGPSDTQSRHHPVSHGETLSAIAEQYLVAGVTSEQVMMAVFDANPKAFSDNINLLYAGATLRIPDENELRRRAPETAMADVRRHTHAWRNDEQPSIQTAQVALEKSYGPVSSGETLSTIAASLLHDGVTMDQMMIALFDANPDAFSDNINVLYAGAILRIPDTDALGRQAPGTATAEVMRHTDAWRTGYWERTPETAVHDNITASNHEVIPQTARSFR